MPIAPGEPACFSGAGIVVQAGEAPDVLVLTRKANQSIMIGDDVEVSVLAIMGEKVRIGIDAPRAVPVFRKEVYLEIKQDRENGSEGPDEVDGELEQLAEPGRRRRYA
jgi:carbon storage regulator